MQSLCRAMMLSIIMFWATGLSLTVSADEPVMLIGTIVKWRYPDAKINKSQMSDAATVNADGKRTLSSTMLKTTLVTSDSVDKVMKFYRKLLTRNTKNDATLGIKPASGHSVVFSDESADRPFKFHTIMVNSANASTTIIVTRGDNEKMTHITWKRYVK